MGQRGLGPAHSQKGGCGRQLHLLWRSLGGTRGHATTDTSVRVSTLSGLPSRQVGSSEKQGEPALRPEQEDEPSGGRRRASVTTLKGKQANKKSPTLFSCQSTEPPRFSPGEHFGYHHEKSCPVVTEHQIILQPRFKRGCFAPGALE